MDRVNTATSPADRLYCAMELSKNSWLLCIQFPDRQKASVYPTKGGDSQGLMAKLFAACDRWTKVSEEKPSIILYYEAGYDAFWLARFLKARGMERLVVDSASMQVDRRSRRAKTDRIDLAKLLCLGVSDMFGRSSVFQLSMKKTCAARTASAVG